MYLFGLSLFELVSLGVLSFVILEVGHKLGPLIFLLFDVVTLYFGAVYEVIDHLHAIVSAHSFAFLKTL